MKIAERTQLLEHALDTINEAIAINSDEMPYRYILEAGERYADGMQMGIGIYETDPSAPFAFYTVAFKDRRLTLVEHGKGENDLNWRVSTEYLEQLANRKRHYVHNPVEIDLDWLKSRAGF